MLLQTIHKQKKKKHTRNTEGNTTYTNTTLIGHKEGCVIKAKTIQEILEIILVHVHNQSTKNLGNYLSSCS